MHTIDNANVLRFDEAQWFNLRARRRGSPLSGGSSRHGKSTPKAPSQKAFATPQSLAEIIEGGDPLGEDVAQRG